ncbi:MAG: sugar ABC transporter permease [Candidatus Tectomicrobia bacterium]|uniref:Sugar ABC transporter permease n=1 Tax=Tectimicrobiota bacterium TaxID=2528274 RepID=A0A938B724_UNCTE|nr:sugar ABC transporter permease [Candidatus Tectomicrobia bacterium]
MHSTPASRRLWLFLLPAMLLIIVLFVIPIAITGVISLTSLDYRFRWDFVGLENFLALLHDALVPRVLLNTGIYVFVTLLLFHLGLGLVLALLTAALPERPAVLFRLIWLLPRFTPSVVYILLWRLLLDPTDYGLLNRLRAALGAAPVDLLGQHPWSVIIVVNGLTGASLGLIIFTAAIESIPRDLLRAARVDGATTAQLVWRVVLPLLRWPVMFVTTYQTLSLLASFEAILLLTNGGPFYATEVWTLYAYHQAFTFSAFGYGCAMTFVLVLVGIAVSLLYWRMFRLHRQFQAPPIEN